MKRPLELLLLALLLAVLPARAAEPVNVNTATLQDLEELPGIGPVKAQAIISYRQQHGPIASLQDLDAVRGIGPATLANLAPLVVFEAGGEAPAGPPADTAPAAAAPSGQTVDVNHAGRAELVSLPGIGPSKAAAIVEDRERNGPFPSCEALTRVSGIGQATVRNIAGRCAAQ